MNLMGTGMLSSQARRDLSSEVEMKRRFSSQKVRVLMGPRWWSYSCVGGSVGGVLVLNCTIFLSDMPARNSVGLLGLKRRVCGIALVLKREMHCPVSVSHLLDLLVHFRALRVRGECIQFHLAVKAGAEELGTVRGEVNV